MSKKKLSALEETLDIQFRALKLPPYEREYRFHPKRRWRFDFAWPELKIAVEAEGGLYMHGQHITIRNKRTGKVEVTKKQSGHLTIKGFESDCEKYGEAAIQGWRVYRCTTSMIRSGEAIRSIERLLGVV